MSVATLFAHSHAGVLKHFAQATRVRHAVSNLSVSEGFPQEPDVENFPGLKFQSSHAIILISHAGSASDQVAGDARRNSVAMPAVM